MTPDEIRVAEALSACRFLPGSSPKRFVRQIAGRDRSRPLTDRQRAYLWAIAWSWRRQLPAELVALARKYSGGVGIRGRQINAEAYREHVAQTTAGAVKTAVTQAQNLPAQGARRPNADEQCGDWGDDEPPGLWA